MTTRESIENAFADVPYPGDDNIADHQDCLECDEVRSFFKGKTWRELRFPELHEFHGSLPLLTSKGFHYFLPGYMLACLEDWSVADTIPYAVIGIGGYRDDEDQVKMKARENRKNLTRRQREAIAAWLLNLSKNGPPELRNDEDVEYAATQILED